MSESVSVAVFTRDLRVHDNPVLDAASATGRVVPLFVYDDAVAGGFPAGPRERFLLESLACLDSSLRELGARLVTRQGDLVEEVCRVADDVGASVVHIASDVSAFARRRQARLGEELGRNRRELRCHDAVHTVLTPGAVTPSGSGPGKDHFAVFTPYHRRWSEAVKRPLAEVPGQLRLPRMAQPELPGIPGGRSAEFLPGGEVAARRNAESWLLSGVDGYAKGHDIPAADATSRLSPYLHLGCVSARELVERAGDSEGAEAFVRQLAWRDFHHQVLAARPGTSRADYRPRGDCWRDDEEGAQAWREGMTGVPIVDAGMRQLLDEGWMHNRARLITGSFLTKTLYIDWRVGADHFFRHLLDGDVANNCMNWQWVAGTGTDTRPNRVLNPLRQARRYDPDGDYVRRYVPELAGVEDPRIVHEPWRLGQAALRTCGYPAPIIDPDEGRARFQQRRQPGRQR